MVVVILVVVESAGGLLDASKAKKSVKGINLYKGTRLLRLPTITL